MNDFLNITAAADLLGISEATCRNWIKRGLLTPEQTSDRSQPLFSRMQIEILHGKLEMGEFASLQKRRNKRHLHGSGAISLHFGAASKNLSPASDLQDYLLLHPSLSPVPFLLEVMSALLKQRFDCDGQMLLSLLAEGLPISFEDIPSGLAAPAFIYDPHEDTLGLLYLSLQELSHRKKSGTYYTPSYIPKLCESFLSVDCSVLDPACGSGAFLLPLAKHLPPQSLHGYDIDPLSVLITRCNLALAYGQRDAAFLACLRQNIVAMDFLGAPGSPAHETFDLILGNPPWGAVFSASAIAELRNSFTCAKCPRPESYDLFLERSMQLLSPSGKIAFLLPEALLQVQGHQKIRCLLAGSMELLSLSYLGDIFPGVQCPCILIALQQADHELVKGQLCSGNADISFYKKDQLSRHFKVGSKRSVSCSNFHIRCDDAGYAVLQKMEAIPGIAHLKDNADFALGIVTGDNHKYLFSPEASASMAAPPEPVLRGNEILRYRTLPAKDHMRYEPERFQQCAPERFYRAPEKILYRFICDQIVCSLDRAQTLTLNSANILIPHMEGLSAKCLCAILNSMPMQFFYQSTYHSVKVLRAALEEVPIPPVPFSMQHTIEAIVTALESETLPAAEGTVCTHTRTELYRQLDHIIADLFHLTEDEYKMVLDHTDKINLFL